MTELLSQLHEARAVYYSEDLGIVLAWHGGTYVHVYSAESGRETDCFSDFHGAEQADVEAAMAAYVERVANDDT